MVTTSIAMKECGKSKFNKWRKNRIYNKYKYSGRIISDDYIVGYIPHYRFVDNHWKVYYIDPKGEKNV